MWIYEYLQYLGALPLILVFFDLKKSIHKYIIYICVFVLTVIGLVSWIENMEFSLSTWYYFVPLILVPFIAAILPSFDLNINDPAEHEDSDVID